MKRLLILAVASLVSVSAFAQDHMVRMYGWDQGDRASSFDFSMGGNDVEDNADAHSRYALNYAYTIAPQMQLGLTYITATQTTDGKVVGSEASLDNSTTMGLSFYYNLDADILNSGYVAFHYNMITLAELDATPDSGATGTAMILEYGQRWQVGNGWGLNLTYAPSVTYSMTAMTGDADGADTVNTTALAWNFLKFDLLF